MRSPSRGSEPSRLPTALRLGLAGAVFCALAAASYGAVRFFYGVRPALVNIRWTPTIEEIERQHVAERYGLVEAEHLEGTTVGYYLTDLSRDNIRELVLDAAVEDTHYINRQTFRVWRTATRAPYTGWGATWMARLLEVGTLLWLGIGVVLLGLASVERWMPAPVRARLDEAASRPWLRARLADAATVFPARAEWAAAFNPSAEPAEGSRQDLPPRDGSG